jgi:hypothetical protein
MKKGKITGTFVDFSERTHRDLELLPWNKEDWKAELTDMAEAGIDTVILARTMRFGSVYYYSNYFETHREQDYLKCFMEAAAETEVKVFLSGMISDHFFTSSDQDFQRLMKRDVYIYRTIITELLNLYRDHPGIAGVYLSHEADNENLLSPKRFTAAQEFFGNIYQDLKRETDLPILSSPFFTKHTKPRDIADFWRRFLDRPMFDIIAMQDGVGCNREITPEDIRIYYQQITPVFAEKGIEFWNNVETFSFNPGYKESGFDRNKIWLQPAPIERIANQYAVGQTFASKSITWEYGHFLGRKQAGNDYYEIFKKWNLSEGEDGAE